VCNSPDAAGSCAAPTGTGALCDPVCQTGNCQWCSDKCSVAGNGTTSCSSAGTGQTGDTCDIHEPDSSSQYDTCAAANICLPIPGTLTNHCFQHCRTAQNCPGGTACTKRTLSVRNGVDVSVCDPSYSKCDDAAPGACCDPVKQVGCPSGYCYLISPTTGGDSRTVCEYETNETGVRGTVCSSPRDCAPGWTCNPTFQCQQVCDLKNPSSNQCTYGGNCMQLAGNQYGYCPLR
jgi:hypothetical protein